MTSAAGAPLRVGLVGCGYATQECHLPALSRIGEVTAVAVADVDSAALQSVGEKWRVPQRYRSSGDLLADPSVDAVAVCVPPAMHAEVAVAALEAGKHVLVEKPLTISLTEADQLLARAKASPQQSAVGFNLRAHPLVEEARSLLRSGTLGPIRAIRTTFTDRPRNGGALPAWRRSRASGGGALQEKAVHHFDLWRFLLDDEVDLVHALMGEDEETAVISARTRAGTLASAVVSATRPRNDVTVFGEKGELEIALYRFDGLAVSPAHELPGAVRARLRGIGAVPAQFVRAAGAIRRGGLFAWSYAEQWRSFALAVREGEAPKAGVEDGREALLITLAAAKATDEGRSVSIDEIRAASSVELRRVKS